MSKIKPIQSPPMFSILATCPECNHKWTFKPEHILAMSNTELQYDGQAKELECPTCEEEGSTGVHFCRKVMTLVDDLYYVDGRKANLGSS